MIQERRLRVLLVDDDEDDYVMIRDLLSDLPGEEYDLEWVSNYEKALECISSASHAVYLIDYRVGAHNGLELLEAALRKGCKAPLILLTGHGDEGLDMEAMRKGAADYLVKGQITPNMLGRSIRYSVKHAEDLEAVREREESIRTLFNSTFEGILLHEDGKIIDANETFCRMFGYEPRELTGRPIEECCGAELAEVILGGVSAEDQPKEGTGLRKDGAHISLEVSGKSLFYQGRNVRMTAFRDVSERKHMEAQIIHQDRLASIGLLASGLAHEIGTPLGVIRGRAEYLGMQLEGNESQKKGLDVIVSQIDRISKLIRSLMSLARSERSSSATEVSLRDVVEQVLGLMSHEFRKNEIQVQVEIGEDADVRAEPGPLEQVILNLLVNALHAMQAAIKEGRADQHRIVLRANDLGGLWALEVEDTGCGISDKNMKNIFKPFFTTKEVGVGTGLGLATSYRIIQSWGGTMKVRSKEGAGSVFTIILPKI